MVRLDIWPKRSADKEEVSQLRKYMYNAYNNNVYNIL
jgi:hypothetical protein